MRFSGNTRENDRSKKMGERELIEKNEENGGEMDLSFSFNPICSNPFIVFSFELTL